MNKIIRRNNNGRQEWRLDGELHREDGPAVKYSNTVFQWYLNGVEYSFEEYIIAAEWSDVQIYQWNLIHGN